MATVPLPITGLILAQKFATPEGVTTGSAIIIAALLVGITIATIRYPSVAAIIGWVFTVSTLALSILTSMTLRPFYLVAAVTAIAVLTGVVAYGE